MGFDRNRKDRPDRSKIKIAEHLELRSWSKHLKVSKEEIVRAVEKVGNSATAVRKQLGKG